jgi:hypothetical protein
MQEKTALSCHRCLMNTGVEKNEQLLIVENNFDPQMSLSKNKCWYSNIDSFFKAHCSIVECKEFVRLGEARLG